MKIKILILILISISIVSSNANALFPSDFDYITANPTVVLGQNYPNPAKNKTVINVEFSSREASLKIYNVLGILVEEIIISKDKKSIILDVTEYKEGIYLYTLEADGQKITKRMTVKNK
ncbi:MAG: T9SS type A sorting domain-containing protein [Bacteroidetes bacterium]|nr:T9SS type A sorting domain-containing protein [Bacteroidota bacterium]